MCRSVEVSNGQVNNTANNRVAAEGVCVGGGGDGEGVQACSNSLKH